MSEEFYNACWYKDCPHYYICNKISNNRKDVCDILKSECDTYDEYQSFSQCSTGKMYDSVLKK